MEEVWIVGRSFWDLGSDNQWNWTWDLHGIFQSQAAAEALCQDCYWFVVPMNIDEPLPLNPQEFPGLVVPNKREVVAMQWEGS